MPQAKPADEQPYRLTRNQEDRWSASTAGPREPADQMSPTYLVTGSLDPGLLADALTAVAARHEALRIRITPDADGAPRATLRDDVPEPFPVQFVDLSGLAEDAQTKIAAHYGSRESAIPLDLEHDLPLRVMLIRLNASEHLLLLSLSHLVADGWSTGVLVRELQACYRALSSGAPLSDLPAIPPYSRHVETMEDHYLSGRASEQLDWWHKQLDGVSWTVPLSHTAAAAPERTSHSALTIPFELDAGTSEALRLVAVRHGTTVYVVALAAFAATLSDWAHVPEVLVTVAYAGRDDEDDESTIGLFTNRLALRIPVDHGGVFADLLTVVYDVLLDALDHADTPFNLIQESLRSAGIPVTAQVTIQIYPRAMCDAPQMRPDDLRLQLLGFRTAALHRELALFLVEPDGMPCTGWLSHQTEVLPPREAANFLTRYRHCLESAARRPESAVTREQQLEEDGRIPFENDSWVNGTGPLRRAG